MPSKKKRTTQKKSARKPAKRNAKTIKAASKSVARKKKFSPKRKKVTSTGVVATTVPVSSVERLQPRDEESGDLQGLAKPAIADSQSVEELLNEGNALEADAIQGVENALDAGQGEVESDEAADDDIPEYLE